MTGFALSAALARISLSQSSSLKLDSGNDLVKGKMGLSEPERFHRDRRKGFERGAWANQGLRLGPCNICLKGWRPWPEQPIRAEVAGPKTTPT